MTSDLVYLSIEQILKRNDKSVDGMRIVKNLNDFTIWLYKEAIVKFKIGKISYFYVKKDFEDEISNIFEYEKVSSPAGWIRFIIESIDDIMKIEPVIIQIYEKISVADEFGCCHLYQECSDEGRCVSERIERARACIYRKNLEKGINFYKSIE